MVILYESICGLQAWKTLDLYLNCLLLTQYIATYIVRILPTFYFIVLDLETTMFDKSLVICYSLSRKSSIGMAYKHFWWPLPSNTDVSNVFESGKLHLDMLWFLKEANADKKSKLHQDLPDTLFWLPI